MTGAFFLAQFDALVLEVYDRWSSCAPADLFEINVLLIVADDPLPALMFTQCALFNNITRVESHPNDITVLRYFEGNVTVFQNNDDLITHGLSVPFCKGYLVYVGAVLRNLGLWWFQTTTKRQKYGEK